MLQYFSHIDQELVDLIKDDPVRPEIPADQRVTHNGRVYVLRSDQGTSAVTCIKFLAQVPANVIDLMQPTDHANTAVFYTIWSYVPGSGRELIEQACRAIQQENPNIQTFVTLSPKTEMAQRFHLRNGALLYRENTDTINYIYK